MAEPKKSEVPVPSLSAAAQAEDENVRPEHIGLKQKESNLKEKIERLEKHPKSHPDHEQITQSIERTKWQLAEVKKAMRAS